MIEKGADLGTVTHQIIVAAKEIAAEVDLSEETMVTRAMEGALEAARASGEEAVVEVIESLSNSQ